MKRGWLGVATLLIFLALGFMTAEAMENAHRPTQVLLEQAANATLSGEFDRGVALGMEAKSQWERHWNGTAAVADHSPMDDVDALFAEMEIYAKAGEAPHFAACCTKLSRMVRDMGDAHQLNLWNLL